MKASLLIVDDSPDLLRALGDRCRHWGHEVTTAPDGEQALALAARQAFDLVILDLGLPGLSGLEVLERLKATDCSADVVVLTAHGSVQNAVEAVKRGAEDFLTKPADFDLLQRVVERCLERRRLARLALAAPAAGGGPVVGPSPAMRRVVETAERAALADTTVLLTGESGSGKQVMAEHIHAVSPRARGPFVYVNCVAISDDLIESTLFGHERGAFTGAVQRKAGRLEIATGGTAFLDEIGDISAGLQTKLLHFLEAGEFERVGGNQTVRVDCRLIAATNRDLAADVAAGRFREDLYYRLNVIALRVPPLRERAEDVPILAARFLARSAADLKRPRLHFAARTLDVMQAYAWPGNVRQLKNAVERMAVLAPEDALTPDLLPPEVLTGPTAPEVDEDNLGYREAVTACKRRLVLKALARTGGNQTRAAELLGLQRSYLNRLMKDLDIAL
ncbi:MAG TPA: sigma-54 dependent transcriptional regulator [Candidatus Krumholzibacteria bacterium]|nr:sigma-54 dependent transcriptional regulator [Candidatus Krumholzibacteria bacterium]